MSQATTPQEQEDRKFTINFGPQHPAAHGVLRLVMDLDGERVDRIDPHIGLLHRGTEKLIDTKPICRACLILIAWTMSPMNQEHAFSMAVERMLGIMRRNAGNISACCIAKLVAS